MKSITLVNPPSPWLISDKVEVPLGVLYLASYLREQNIDVRVLDLAGEKYNKDYKIPETDIYGISFTTPQFVYAKEILKEIRKQHPNKKVIAGGIHSTSLPNEMLKEGFDIVVAGEGETAVTDIMALGLEKIIYVTDYIKDLDTLPPPAWDLIDLESYLSNIDVVEYMESGKEVEREINMIVSRGCTGECAFCNVYKGPLRWRSPDNVINDIEELQNKYQVNRIFFVDDNLTINREWLSKLCSKLKDNGIKWHCLGRTDTVNYETCKTMYDSGCMGIDFGVESGSQRILDIIKKHTTVEKQERGLRVAYEAGLKVRAQLITGLPQEDKFTHKENLEFISKNNKYVDKWAVHNFIPFPSCEIWQHPEKFNYNIDKNTDFSNYQTIGKPNEWNFVPKENRKNTIKRRNELLALIDNKNIYEMKK